MLQHKYHVGRLDRRIVIQESTETKDVYGQPVKTWATLATVWAQVDDKSGGETYQAEQLTAYRKTVFVIRFRSGIEERMRILYNNRYYDILSKQAPDRNRFLVLEAELLDDPVEASGRAFSDAFSSAFA